VEITKGTSHPELPSYLSRESTARC
jgi:hypothetical protein